MTPSHVRRHCLLLAVLILGQAHAFAQTAPNTRSLDSILDRLEKKLRDSDKPLADRQAPLDSYAKPSSDRVPVLKFKEDVVHPERDPNSDLSDLTAEINRLSSEAEQFSTEVQTLKQNLIGNAKKRNHIEITAELEEPDTTALRTLRVSIDGYEVYRLNESVGIWQARKTHMLYAGPLQAGKHVIDFEARVAPKERDGIALTQSVYTTITKSFDITVVKGRKFENWLIKVHQAGENSYDATIMASGMVARAEKGP